MRSLVRMQPSCCLLRLSLLDPFWMPTGFFAGFLSALSTKNLLQMKLVGVNRIPHPRPCPTYRLHPQSCRTCRKHQSVNTRMTVIPRVKVDTTGRHRYHRYQAVAARGVLSTPSLDSVATWMPSLVRRASNCAAAIGFVMMSASISCVGQYSSTT